MPSCFWTGFINARETECSDVPDVCAGVPPPPSAVALCGSTGQCELDVEWVMCDFPPAGYTSQAPQCRSSGNTPNTWTLFRTCDGQPFVVGVSSADIVCC